MSPQEQDAMKFDDYLEQALAAAQPVDELRALAQHLLNEGYDRSRVLELFENARQKLRSANREKDEDAVMDVMDFLVGWCSPHMKLLDRSEWPGFFWKYPIYFIRLSDGFAVMDGKKPSGEQVTAMVICTDLDLTERFIRNSGFEGSPVAINSLEEFATFLEAIKSSVGEIAFDAPDLGQPARWCVKIHFLLGIVRAFRAKAVEAQPTAQIARVSRSE